jgi:hypothetical protein
MRGFGRLGRLTPFGLGLRRFLDSYSMTVRLALVSVLRRMVPIAARRDSKAHTQLVGDVVVDGA